MTTRVHPTGINTEKVQRRTHPLLRPLLLALCLSLVVVRGEANPWAPRLHSTRWIHHRTVTTPQKRTDVVPHRRLLMTGDASDDVDAPPYAEQDSDSESVTPPAVGGLFGSFVQGLFAPVSAQAAAVVDRPIPIPSSPTGMDPVQVRPWSNVAALVEPGAAS